MMLKTLITIFTFFLLCLPVNAGDFFSDDFESGDLSTIGTDGTTWTNSKNISVNTTNPRSGSYSLEFFYEGNSDLSDDAHAEQRFEFGTGKDDFYIRYYIYFPLNYTIREPNGVNNNKYIVFQHGSCYDPTGIETSGTGLPSFSWKAAISGWPQELDCDGNFGFIPDGDSEKITEDMLGRWVSFEHHVKHETGTELGELQTWVDGKLVLDNQNLTFANGPCCDMEWNQGYLMGWSSSGFDEDTYIYIDDVVISDSYIGPEDTNSAPLPLPPPDEINVSE